MNSPLVSIITVCLNDLEGLKKTAASVIEQDFHNFEWIVIDGVSSDGSAEFLKMLGKDYLRFISEADEGIYDAMNKGIGLSRGQYLLFLNAGDYLCENNVLSSVSTNLKGDLVVGRVLCSGIDGSNNKEIFRNLSKQDVRKKYIYHKPVPHPSTFISKELFKKYGLYDKNYKIFGDHDFFARVIVKGVSPIFWDKFVTVFSSDGISTKMQDSDLWKKEKKIMRKNNFSKIYRSKRVIVDFIENIIGVSNFKN